jgi:hypothetical protein
MQLGYYKVNLIKRAIYERVDAINVNSFNDMTVRCMEPVCDLGLWPVSCYGEGIGVRESVGIDCTDSRVSLMLLESIMKYI